MACGGRAGGSGKLGRQWQPGEAGGAIRATVGAAAAPGGGGGLGMWVWDATGSGCIFGVRLTGIQRSSATAQPVWKLDCCGGGAGADAQAEPRMMGLKTRRTIVLNDRPWPWLGVAFFFSRLLGLSRPRRRRSSPPSRVGRSRRLGISSGLPDTSARTRFPPCGSCS